MLKIQAGITEITYNPQLCRELRTFDIDDLQTALKNASFKLDVNDTQVALSWWVSPKRTRSYPYQRVYDTLMFPGKKITIIPIMKDEGADGDRDYLQWDTISLMSLLGIFVIVAYYDDAEKSSKYDNKITNQRFDVRHLKSKISGVLAFQNSPLEWNLQQIDALDDVIAKALIAYERISKIEGVKLHSFEQARKRLEKISDSRDSFRSMSRELAKQAQLREGGSEQPAENVDGTKSIITITDRMGGKYFLTVDEILMDGDTLVLVEAKHTSQGKIPSMSDIKDGLLKMSLFSNLEDGMIGNKSYKLRGALKLTSKRNSRVAELTGKSKKDFEVLLQEGTINGFQIIFNDFSQP